MKAVLVRNGASEKAEDLYLGDAPTPKLNDGQALVRVHAFGLNRMDCTQRRGQYPLPPGTTEILGVEFSGTIEDAGTTQWKTGDEVFGLTYGGAYAELVAVAGPMLTRKPSELSHVQAAAIPEQWLTAFQALHLVGDLKSGQKLLFHAGASGVGLAAIQLGQAAGAKVFITAGSDEKVKFCESLGATGFNYRSGDWAEAVKKATDGAGVDLIVDPVGADYFQKDIDVLARDGTLVMLGLLSGGKVSEAMIAPILFKRLTIRGTTLRSRTVDYQADLLKRFSEEALGLVIDGVKSKGAGHTLQIHKVYQVSQIVEATQEMEQAKNTGKIVIDASEFLKQ